MIKYEKNNWNLEAHQPGVPKKKPEEKPMIEPVPLPKRSNPEREKSPQIPKPKEVPELEPSIHE